MKRNATIDDAYPGLLLAGAEELGISLTGGQVAAFGKYLQELKVWGRRINLTARANEREIILKDFVDSLSISRFIQEYSSVLDLGSGAGFPGIPLKIARPDLRVVILEIRQKRVFFLKNLVRALALSGVEVKISPSGEMDGAFDFVVSRAFGGLGKLAAAAFPFLRTGGTLLAMKGLRGEEELARELPALERFELVLAHAFKLPVLGHNRTVIGLQRR